MLTIEEAGRALVDPEVYAEDQRLHEALTLLREQDPVHWVDPLPDYRPFWAITRHADILHVEACREVFLNEPRSTLSPVAEESLGRPTSTLIHMDGRHHDEMRAIAAGWFKPRTLRTMEIRIEELARQYVDRMVESDGQCDFVTDVAVHFPLAVILSLLGLPESDYPVMLKLTQQIFGNRDPDLQRALGPSGKLAALAELGAYFADLTARRRAQPTDDLASEIANARIGGELLPDREAISYYAIVATAGHDTTSATIAGGLHALISNPEQMERLRQDPSLMPTAVEEIIRWVTPVKNFMRTAAVDTEVGGVAVRAGEDLLLCYPSANRDSAVFDDPFAFDIGRTPNRQLAFGYGAHYCLGAALARMEVRALLAELLPRIGSIELAGEPQWMQTTFVGGLKRLPVRYTATADTPPADRT